MSYCEALRANGAQILDYKQFGDYQGTWLALVLFMEELGFCNGSYGSCSGCDAAESELGNLSHTADNGDFHCSDFHLNAATCKDCERAITRMKEFGKGYLPPVSLQMLLPEYKERAEWDSDAPEVVKWATMVWKEHGGICE